MRQQEWRGADASGAHHPLHDLVRRVSRSDHVNGQGHGLLHPAWGRRDHLNLVHAGGRRRGIGDGWCVVVNAGCGDHHEQQQEECGAERDQPAD